MIGTTVGHYEVLAKIGEGGMGEVYRARDTKLDREVAIKVLPEHSLDSADARSRFEREAKAVAALSHPNILAIHDFGEHDGVAYAVTELLEGESLAERLQEGPLPARKAIELAGQMADGLAAAHEKGIVHRDLKPANVFLVRDGRLKILDFGLAKALTVETQESLTATLQQSTSPGTVMGTVRYMSPEQARGNPVDHRSDIFSFGAVLWEMLSGHAAFQRDSAVETMGAILKEDPGDLTATSEQIPPSVDRVIHRCLEKKPEHRFQSAQDLAFALRNALDTTSRSMPELTALPVERNSRLRPAVAALGLLVIGGLAGAWIQAQTHTPEAFEPVKISNLTQSGRDYFPAASPDGKIVAFASDRDGVDRIWLRQMQGGIEAPLTDGVDGSPQFSPDGASVLFMRSEGSIPSAYRVPVVGGLPRKLLENAVEARWSPAGDRVAFLRSTGTTAAPITVLGIREVQSGGSVELARFENRFLYGITWSPDGRWIAASTSSAVQNTTQNELLLIDADTGAWRAAHEVDTRLSKPAWSPDGESLVVAQSTSLLGDISGALGRVLLVDPFRDREPAVLFWVQSVWAGSSDIVTFDFLDEDSIVFDEILWRGSLTEVGLTGERPHSEGARLTHGKSRDRQPAYSPDGSKIIFSSNRSGNLDLWSLEPNTGEVRQLTDDLADDWDPAFSADGQSILWSSNRGGHLEIWTARSDGSGAHQLSHDGEDAENPTQTPDGQWVVYGSGNPAHNGIWRIRNDGTDGERIAEGSYLLPEISPTGRYVAYSANDVENQRIRIFVQDLESLEVVLTTEVGFLGIQSLIQPGRTRWMPDGESFVFVGPTPDGALALHEQDFRPGEDTLQTRRLLVSPGPGEDIESFGISPDGRAITVSRIDHLRSLKLAEGDFSRRR